MAVPPSRSALSIDEGHRVSRAVRPAFLLQSEDGLRLFLWADNLALVSAVSFRRRYWRAIQIVIILGMERHEPQRRGATGPDLVQHARNRCKILISGGRGLLLPFTLPHANLSRSCHARPLKGSHDNRVVGINVDREHGSMHQREKLPSCMSGQAA